MASSDRRREKQVRLTGFDNEPMARLAEQRLRENGIPCMTRSLRGGPGLWGSSFNLPHEIVVYESDEVRARDLLGLNPPEETERETRLEGGRPLDRRLLFTGALLVLIALALAFQTWRL